MPEDTAIELAQRVEALEAALSAWLAWAEKYCPSSDRPGSRNMMPGESISIDKGERTMRETSRALLQREG